MRRLALLLVVLYLVSTTALYPPRPPSQHIHTRPHTSPHTPFFPSAPDNSSLVLVCPDDTQGDASAAAAPLAPLLWHVPPETLASLLAALLLERRVIVAAHDLDRLSRVVHAAAALLYPFQCVAARLSCELISTHSLRLC